MSSKRRTRSFALAYDDFYPVDAAPRIVPIGEVLVGDDRSNRPHKGEDDSTEVGRKLFQSASEGADLSYRKERYRWRDVCSTCFVGGPVEGVRFERWRNILIVDWWGEGAQHGVERTVREVAALRQIADGPVGIFNVVGENGEAPNAHGRARLSRLFQEEPLAFNILAIEGSGFRSAAVRSIASGIFRVVQVPFPLEAHPSVEVATRRVSKVLEHSQAAARHFAAAVEQFIEHRGRDSFRPFGSRSPVMKDISP